MTLDIKPYNYQSIKFMARHVLYRKYKWHSKGDSMTEITHNLKTGFIAGRINWTENLFSLRIRIPGVVYTAGQFVKLALSDEDGELQRRAYSIVNHPKDYAQTGVIELLIITDPTGRLSPLLHKLRTGDEVYVSSEAAGFMTVNEIPTSQSDLWLLSTGTAIGPFLSMLEGDIENRFNHVTLVHAVRHKSELVYQDKLESIKARLKSNFHYLPIVSREQVSGALHGRIPDLISSGKLDQAVGKAMDKKGSFIYLCGNPQMVKDTSETLKSLGLTKHLRKEPGHFSSENYW